MFDWKSFTSTFVLSVKIKRSWSMRFLAVRLASRLSEPDNPTQWGVFDWGKNFFLIINIRRLQDRLLESLERIATSVWCCVLYNVVVWCSVLWYCVVCCGVLWCRVVCCDLLSSLYLHDFMNPPIHLNIDVTSFNKV
jgi:hypothetical protein